MGLTLLNLNERRDSGLGARDSGFGEERAAGGTHSGKPPLADARGSDSAVARVASGEARVATMEAASPAELFGSDAYGYRPLGMYGGPRAAVEAGRHAGAGQTWRSVPTRDMMPTMHARMQQVAYYLYLVNPLAHRIVEHTKNYVIGDGVEVKAESAAAQRVLDAFWQDPVNQLDVMLPEIVKELTIFGEQCWLAAVNPVNGRVRLGYLDPAEIEAVEWGEIGLEVGGENLTAVSRPVAVWRKSSRFEGGTEKDARRFRIVRVDEDPESETYGRLAGECFYFAINKARTASRGVSDLFAIGDYLDGYDKMLFGLIDRVGFANAFIWDVLLKGATEEQIQDWLKDQRAPRPGSVRAHNENVEWKAVSPMLRAQDFNEAARTIKNMNLAGAGFPEHWFAEGGNVNRATALEMGGPSLKMLLERQGYVAFMLRGLLDYVIDQAVAAGTLAENESRRFWVQMPEMSVQDLAKAAEALERVGTTAMELRRAGLIDSETAQRMIATVAVQLNVEMDLHGGEGGRGSR